MGDAQAHMPATCPICGSGSMRLDLFPVADYLTGDSFAITVCGRCKTGMTTPTPASLDRFYPDRYRKYASLVVRLMIRLYQWRVSTWTRMRPRSGEALEIGCGSGWMLRALRDRGWRVLGTERSVEDCRFAHDVNRIPVMVGDLDAISPHRRFDLIILFHVLEHMPDPQGTLVRAARLLRPGGMVVVAVPDRTSLQARLSGANWFHLDVPRHLYHFSPEGLSTVLRGAGLEVVRMSDVSPELEVFGWAQSALNGLGFPQNQLTKAIAGIRDRSPLTTLGVVLASLPVGVASVLLSGLAWITRTGAIMEVWAVAPKKDGSS